MLANILDGLFFICGLIGLSSMAGAIENNGNFIIPLALILASYIFYKLARYENGDLKRNRR